MTNGVQMTREEAMKNHAIAKALAAQERTYRQPLRPLDQLDDASEAVVVAEICDALYQAGFSTPTAGVNNIERKNGPGYFVRVGQRRADEAGSDAGVPDILVSIKGLPFALTFEVKERKRGKRGGWIGGKKSDEQKLLEKHGCVRIVRSAIEVMDAVRNALRVFAGNNGASLRAALERKP